MLPHRERCERGGIYKTPGWSHASREHGTARADRILLPALHMSHPVEEKEHLRGGPALEKARALLGNFRSAMLTTSVAGQIHTRPMGLQGKASEFDGSLWFFADDRATVVSEISAGSTASLILQSDAENAYLQLDGGAVIDPDRTRMEELFTPLVRTWFPAGLDDPHLTLLRFDVTRGSYWESPGGVVQVLAAFARTMLTGERGQGGDAGDFDLRS
jgi:general stress protein 26